MPEIIFEISLNRSSGVLAGVVASLAQVGIELKSQKLKRASEGKGGWLSIVGEGVAPAPATLAERLNATRGVDRLMRVVIDGEVVLAQGEPLDDQIGPDDLAELSAGSETLPAVAEEDAPEEYAPEEYTAEEDTAEAKSAKADTPPESEAEAPRGIRSADDGADSELAAAPGSDDSEAEPGTEDEASATPDEERDPDRVEASLRRRRRRRK